jgi:hypothetical protein
MLVVAVFVLAEAGLVLLMNAVLAGASPLVCLGAAVLLALALGGAAYRYPRARTFAPVPWSVAMMLAGVTLAAGAPGERSLVVASAMLTFMEVAIVTAVAMLFSSFSTPFLSALLTLGIFVVGRSADTMSRLPPKVFGEAMHEAGRALATVVPNLQIYVPARTLLTGEAADANLTRYLALAFVQTGGWIILLLVLAAFVFQRRDFT